jgi:hypothetical protein
VNVLLLIFIIFLSRKDSPFLVCGFLFLQIHEVFFYQNSTCGRRNCKLQTVNCQLSLTFAPLYAACTKHISLTGSAEKCSDHHSSET